MEIGALLLPGADSGAIVKTDHFDYKVIQKAVGGLIERAYLSKELDKVKIHAYVNEEGKIKNLKPSAIVYEDEKIADVIAGPILFVGHDESGAVIGLNEEQKDWVAENLVEFAEYQNKYDEKDILKLLVFRR